MSTVLHKILDQGKEEGRQEGRQEGIQKGRQEGTQITLRKTAKKMLQQGIDISIIQTVTDLSKEEILALQKKSSEQRKSKKEILANGSFGFRQRNFFQDEALTNQKLSTCFTLDFPKEISHRSH